MIEKRIVKVYNCGGGWKQKARACVSVQGDWVEALGFTVGTKLIVEIKSENNKNIIILRKLDDQ